MALKKDIELDNGVLVNYHRIFSINTIINKEIQIIIYSYISSAKRLEEIETSNNEENNMIISSEMITKEYEEAFDIIKAYEYLKTTDRFKNAEDC